MQQLAEFFKTQPLRGLTRISVRMNAQAELMVWLQGKAAPALIEALKAQVAGLVVNAEVAHGKAFFTMTVGAHRYRVSAQSFFQVNTDMAEAMLGVLDTWFPDPIDSLADVYCGVGLFAKHLAGRVRGTVYGFESSETAYADAQANALRVKLRLGPVERSLARLEEKVAVAVVDPPRGGCSKPVIAWLNQQVTEQIVLISCDPTTLARDLQRLSEKWQLEAVQPLDMFPQTYHVEAMALLRRRRPQ
jgi:23S rRNA (uracil1939-C5)-methyltransferase